MRPLDTDERPTWELLKSGCSLDKAASIFRINPLSFSVGKTSELTGREEEGVPLPDLKVSPGIGRTDPLFGIESLGKEVLEKLE